ncbi:MAG TPA: hypothetical protein VGF69_14965 [Thermoanaerobaculia bacterium]|jgi:hypothetical protein
MTILRASGRYSRAIEAAAELLTKLRLEAIFVGNVARAAWLGSEVGSGSVDVIALMGPQQKEQVAMMASNRGFRLERDEIEQSEELDLIPLNFVDPEGEVRVHVLVASNALYGRMVSAGTEAELGTRKLRVARAEDLALMLAVADDSESLRDREKLIRMPEFDRHAYNAKLTSIGLGGMVVPE